MHHYYRALQHLLYIIMVPNIYCVGMSCQMIQASTYCSISSLVTHILLLRIRFTVYTLTLAANVRFVPVIKIKQLCPNAILCIHSAHLELFDLRVYSYRGVIIKSPISGGIRGGVLFCVWFHSGFLPQVTLGSYIYFLILLHLAYSQMMSLFEISLELIRIFLLDSSYTKKKWSIPSFC